MIKKLLITIPLLIALLLPQIAAAYDPTGAACNAGGGAKSSVACGTNGSNTLTGSNGAINKVTRIIAIIAGVAAVIIIIVSGLMFITSGGDPQQSASARNTLIYALVGLAVIVLAQAIITFVVSKL